MGRRCASTARSLGAAVLAACLAAACGRSGPPAGGAGPTPTATATPQPDDVGDGHDGPLTVNASAVLSPCHPVELASGADATLTGTVGRRLLVMQVQDEGAMSGDPAVLDSANTPGFAGLWEVGRVVALGSAAGDTSVSFEVPLARAYDSVGTRRAQACEMREYTDVTVTDGNDINAETWDGSRGGVVAFFASGTVDLAGDLDAEGAGFRGGSRGQDQIAFDVTDLDPLATEGGGKGEGLDGASLARFGRGNYWNSGGGADSRSRWRRGLLRGRDGDRW